MQDAGTLMYTNLQMPVGSLFLASSARSTLQVACISYTFRLAICLDFSRNIYISDPKKDLSRKKEKKKKKTGNVWVCVQKYQSVPLHFLTINVFYLKKKSTKNSYYT